MFAFSQLTEEVEDLGDVFESKSQSLGCHLDME